MGKAQFPASLSPLIRKLQHLPQVGAEVRRLFSVAFRGFDIESIQLSDTKNDTLHAGDN